jgi:hypothetical protein
MKKALLYIIVIGLLGGGGYYAYKQGWFENMGGESQQAEVKVPDTSGATPEAIAEIPKLNYSETYAHPSGDFSFKYPKDYSVSSIPAEEGEIILVQNIKTSIGVQILISDYEGSNNILTADDISASIPGLEIKEPQELLIGINGKDGKGVAFLSNNESFGGKSREVWFPYKGKLYQISTYTDLDEFLKGVFSTWAFK